MTTPTTSTATHSNRTGVSRDPEMSKDMMKGSDATIDGTDTQEFFDAREKEMAGFPPVATMPPPAHPQKVISSLLLDKLGERLAFERSGTRLYETLVLKRASAGGFAGGPTRGELESICADELSHFAMLESVIARLGGDPTAVTPSANLVSVETKGICAVINDPRTTLAEGLHAILIAELADTEGWKQLIDLAGELDLDNAAELFRSALEEERKHLDSVREWLAADLLNRR
jgi:rubrerythrin